MKINTIAIIGAGNLGTRIGLQASISGFKVVVHDISETQLQISQKNIQQLFLQLKHDSTFNMTLDSDCLKGIRYTSSLQEAVSHADLIIESVTEDALIKTAMWKEVGALAAPQAICTTNTSHLLPSQFAQISGRPQQFCAFHFHDVFQSRVVDIMPHESTDMFTIDTLEIIARQLNQVPILVKKEHAGYIFNTLLISWIDAAGRLLTGEVAEIEAIDKSWMINFKMSSGPFGVLDKVGLDTAWHITSTRRNPASKAFAALLKTYVDQGKLGEKSGEGFYKYPHPAYQQADFLK